MNDDAQTALAVFIGIALVVGTAGTFARSCNEQDVAKTEHVEAMRTAALVECVKSGRDPLLCAKSLGLP